MNQDLAIVSRGYLVAEAAVNRQSPQLQLLQEHMVFIPKWDRGAIPNIEAHCCSPSNSHALRHAAGTVQ
jgi:hypothetical protein